MEIKIKPRKKKAKTGFDPHAKQRDRKGWRYVAVEINQEKIRDGDFDNAEVLSVIQIHHLAIAPVEGRTDKALIEAWSDAICFAYISPTEFLAEIYVTTIIGDAMKLGANVARVYHNSHLGDTRIHGNSIGHVFYPTDTPPVIPDEVRAVMEKYVVVECIADGSKITWKNRLAT